MSRWEELWAKPSPPAVNGHAVVTPINGASRYALKALERECDEVSATPEGGRNHRLNVAAFNLGTLVAAGHLEQQPTEDALLSAARASGLGESESLATIASGIKGGRQHPRDVPEPVATDVPEATVLDEHDYAAEDTFWAARPLLWHLQTFARARRVSPWAVLGCTLARVVAATPPTVLLPPLVGGYASLNTFVGLVGKSGAGKGAATAVSEEALDVGHISTVKTGSGEGIGHAYMRRVKGGGTEMHTQCVLFNVPEIDTLTALGNRQGATLLPELRSGWSGEQLGFAYADPTKRLDIRAHTYRMCLIAGIQPHRAAPLLNDSDAGTPQRFLWLPATDPEAPDAPPGAPQRLTWKPLVWGRMKGLTGIYGTAMDVCDQAQDVILAARLARIRGEGEALDGHALLTRLKTAAALALLEERLDVTDDDWQLASVIAKRSAATRSGVAAVLVDTIKASNRGRAEAEAERAITVSDRMVDEAARRVAKNILKAMHRLGADGQWVPSNEVRSTIYSKDRKFFELAAERLYDAGQIDEETTTGGHLRGCRYRLVTGDSK